MGKVSNPGLEQLTGHINGLWTESDRETTLGLDDDFDASQHGLINYMIDEILNVECILNKLQ